MTRHVQTNFRAEDFARGSSSSKQTGGKEQTQGQEQKQEQEQTPRSSAAPTATKHAQHQGNEVPDGTSEEILAWVGKDARRARRALQKEKNDDNPRESLTEGLQNVISEDRARKRAEAEAKAKRKTEEDSV